MLVTEAVIVTMDLSPNLSDTLINGTFLYGGDQVAIAVLSGQHEQSGQPALISADSATLSNRLKQLSLLYLTGHPSPLLLCLFQQDFHAI